MEDVVGTKKSKKAKMQVARPTVSLGGGLLPTSVLKRGRDSALGEGSHRNKKERARCKLGKEPDFRLAKKKHKGKFGAVRKSSVRDSGVMTDDYASRWWNIIRWLMSHQKIV